MTILIVIAGMADLPDQQTDGSTPLEKAHVPALDTLARRGDLIMTPTVAEDGEVSHAAALLSLLGYDTDKGLPAIEQLMEFGLNSSARISEYSTLRPFIIPGFSGHGVCITTSAWVRGVAKCALLKPLDIYSPGSADSEILNAISSLAKEAIGRNEFVLIYVDSPLRASLRGKYHEKVAALETIDRHLVTPVADFVWKSELMINLAVTTDLVTPWHRRMPSLMDVPALVYFNNNDREGLPEQKFTEINAMLTHRHLSSPSDLIKYLINFYADDDE